MKVRESKYLIYDHEIDANLKYHLKQIKSMVQAKLYKACMNVFYPKGDTDKKYNVTICAIFKNEGKYFKEWIEWHKIIGIDHFYLYNNNSDDNYMDVLKPYIDEGTVDLIDWPYDQAQMKAYADCIKNRSNEASWIGFIDLDEFIVPIQYNNIADFLKKFKKNRPSVLLYWQFFGTSGIMKRPENSLVTESFHSCWAKHDIVGKCFFNTKYSFDKDYKRNTILHHILWGKYKNFEFPMVNFCDKVCLDHHHPINTDEFPIQINHYFTKSFDEYDEKASKGDVYFKKNPHNLEYFYKHESLCTSRDYSVDKYMIKLKLIMEEEE